MTYGKHRNTMAPHVGIFSRVRDATLENPMDDPPEFFSNICLWSLTVGIIYKSVWIWESCN